MKNILIGITYASIFGLTFMFTKVGISYAQPISILAFRFSFAFFGVLILYLLKIIKVRIRKIFNKNMLYLILMQPILGFSFEIVGIQYVKSFEAGIFVATIPIIVAVVSNLFLNEKPNFRQIIYIFLGFFGVIYIQYMNYSGELSFSIFGSVLIFVSVFCAAMFNIFSRKVSKLMYPSEITFLMMFVGFVFFMSWYLISLLLSNNINDFFLPFKNINSTLAILYLGFVASILGFFLVNHNLKHFPAHVSSIFANIATIVSILAGVIFLGERIYLHHIIGSIMIMIGVYGVVSNNKNRNTAQ